MYIYLFLVTLLLAHSFAAPKTWAERGIHYQYELQADIPIDQIVWIGSHNSFSYERTDYNDSQTGPPNSNLLSQKLLLAKQIDLGVRHLEFNLQDLSAFPQFPSPHMVCNGNEIIYEACYGEDAGIQVSSLCSGLLRIVDYGPKSTGCFSFYDRSIIDNLDELQYEVVRRSVDKNFYIVHLQKNYNANDDFTDIINSYIESNFTDALVYTPADLVADLGKWPTLNEMRDRGKRILFYGFDATTTAYPVTMIHEAITPFVFPATVLKGFEPGVCDSNGYDIPAHTPFVTFFEDQTKIGSYFDASDLVGSYTEESDVKEVMKCLFSPIMDNIDEHKIAWANWVWEYDEPRDDVMNPPTTSCTTMNRNTGRWMTQECTITRSYCCKNNLGNFTFSINEGVGNVDNSSVTCPDGYFYGPPSNINEQNELRKVCNKRVASCWINAPRAYKVDPYQPPLPDQTESEFETTEEESTSQFSAENGNVLKYCDIDLRNFTNGLSGGGQDTSEFQNICDWEGYLTNVIDTSMGFIVFTIILLGLSVIFWIGICVFFCHKCCEGESDNEGNEALSFVLYSIPAVIAVIGLICIMVGSTNVSSAFNVAEQDARILFDRIVNIQERGILQYNTLTDYFDQDIVDDIFNQMDMVLNEIDSTLDTISATRQEIDTIRSTATLIFGITPLVLLIIGFLFYKCGSPVLVTLYLFLANIIMLIVVIIMVLHFSLGIVQQDLCQELTRDDGLLVLLKEQANAAFEGVQLLLKEAVPAIVNDGCLQLRELCNLDGQECGSGECGRNEVEIAIETITIYDEEEGRDKSLEECADTCTNKYLKARSKALYVTTNALLDFLNLLDEIRSLLNGIVSGDTIGTFTNNFCEYMGTALTMMYIGCGAASVALVSSIALLMFLMW